VTCCARKEHSDALLLVECFLRNHAGVLLSVNLVFSGGSSALAIQLNALSVLVRLWDHGVRHAWRLDSVCAVD